MTDKEFLLWLHYRLIHRYGESENTDFVIRLKAIAWRSDDSFKGGKPDVQTS
jgi:hypothetical protein